MRKDVEQSSYGLRYVRPYYPRNVPSNEEITRQNSIQLVSGPEFNPGPTLQAGGPAVSATSVE